ncbi:MAG: LytTR family DNA-binding domain-containing protein [Aliidiomarina sp.]|uniref:LytR/AlgR family response regulator transcription factor n=1 Tax=Aliidiomarina sp. TaxID=1872439 RepID=UPI0025C675C1|nr:LytTR family DNA-binding domain-containing protein [Aliidiomarina sp.]MCH8502660.1 LytTR family DNA-binding domain-containing protein [Aliidiomarina sp.]
MHKRLMIVDDEQAARLKLQQLLSHLPQWQVVAELNSGEALLQKLKETDAEVVLLDINMTGINGIEVLQQLNEQGFAGEVIFVTAYSSHAVAAFDAAAADYILKPINASRLQLALERAEQKLSAKQRSQEPQELVSHVGQRVRTVRMDSIDAIVTRNGVQEAWCGDQAYPLSTTLRDLEAELPEHFLRVHRAAIVNRYRLAEAERWLNGRLLLRFVQSKLEVLTSRNGARQLKKHLKM